MGKVRIVGQRFKACTCSGKQKIKETYALRIGNNGRVVRIDVPSV